MSEQTQRSEEPSSSSKVLVILFWGYVSLPLAWGVYETSKGVVALFTG
ncbi:MAG: oxalate:formate antiporter [Actinomycetota bacterium]|jgi:hypothetical protein|nr:oxalate:formate antiporter [Rubrobacter sp.]MDQ3507747.1 oxalate:formate antiporter [Actinomycetota bacterium]